MSDIVRTTVGRSEVKDERFVEGGGGAYATHVVFTGIERVGEHKPEVRLVPPLR